MMKNLICLMILMTMGFSLGAKADDGDQKLTFICHKGLHYTKAEVTYDFKAYLDEPRPVDNRPLFASMLKTIGYSQERYEKMWSKMFFRRALFIPKMMDGDAGVINWVSHNYGGVGYVKTAPTNNPNVEICGVE